MRISKILSTAVATALMIGMATTASLGADFSKTSSNAKSKRSSPTLGRDRSYGCSTSAASPLTGCCTCQIIGLTTFSCYDPYQMRNAYGTDKLISAGYTGKGKTIVIVDAFQSPRMVAELNFYNSFYALPS